MSETTNANRKIRAYRIIDKLYADGIEKPIIYKNIQDTFGYGELFVDKRIKLLLEIKKIEKGELQ